jgi:hypothetical protein
MKANEHYKERYLGKTFTNKYGYSFTVIAYENNTKVTVKFETGDKVTTNTTSIQTGCTVAGVQEKPKKIIKGDIYESDKHGMFEILEYKSCSEITIKVYETGSILTVSSCQVRVGRFSDPLQKVVQGIGYLGLGKYNRKDHKRCYSSWLNIIQRCYNTVNPNKTYIDCEVHPLWHNFQNFAAWYEGNHIEGYQIDKDIKVEGNKVYGPETCMFVSPQENAEKAAAKTYTMVNPEGEVVTFYNMHKMCRELGLDSSLMAKVYFGKMKTYKGWTAAPKHLKEEET